MEAKLNITTEEKREITGKTIYLLVLLMREGFGCNNTTKISLKLLARCMELMDNDINSFTEEKIELELEFLIKDGMK
jgi:hypothetical protein